MHLCGSLQESSDSTCFLLACAEFATGSTCDGQFVMALSR